MVTIGSFVSASLLKADPAHFRKRCWELNILRSSSANDIVKNWIKQPKGRNDPISVHFVHPSHFGIILIPFWTVTVFLWRSNNEYSFSANFHKIKIAVRNYLSLSHANGASPMLGGVTMVTTRLLLSLILQVKTLRLQGPGVLKLKCVILVWQTLT